MPTTLHPLCGSPHSSCTNYVSPMRFDGTDGCISSMYSSSPSSSVSSAHCAFFCHDMPSGCTNGVSYTCTNGVSYTCTNSVSYTCFRCTSGCISYHYSRYDSGYVSPLYSNGVDACPGTFVMPSCFVLPSWSVLCCRFLRFPHPSPPGCYHHPAVPPLYSCHDPLSPTRSSFLRRLRLQHALRLPSCAAMLRTLQPFLTRPSGTVPITDPLSTA
mmetsp:Transcript_15043/g.34691  ORF Transcript_15043/g.34691 Transcript_15043/m.34691 type:complete len:214 (-) Transcript_15043:463-1104(-)